jgi:hypothetical protein
MLITSIIFWMILNTVIEVRDSQWTKLTIQNTFNTSSFDNSMWKEYYQQLLLMDNPPW